jgi:hypothetical protein
MSTYLKRVLFMIGMVVFTATIPFIAELDTHNLPDGFVDVLIFVILSVPFIVWRSDRVFPYTEQDKSEADKRFARRELQKRGYCFHHKVFCVLKSEINTVKIFEPCRQCIASQAVEEEIYRKNLIQRLRG